MTDDLFFWQQIPGAARLAARVTEEICAHHTVVLHVPERLPWSAAFHELVATAVHRKEAARSLELLDAYEIYPFEEGEGSGLGFTEVPSDGSAAEASNAGTVMGSRFDEEEGSVRGTVEAFSGSSFAGASNARTSMGARSASGTTNARNATGGTRATNEQEIRDAFGDYLLTHFCRPEVQDGFRPALGYDGYLATCRDTTLGASYLWLTDVPAVAMNPWTAFLSDYQAAFQAAKRKQPFAGDGFACLLETTATEAFAKKGIVELSASDYLTSYDSYTFLFFRAGELPLQGTPEAVSYLRPYLAELARNLGGDDVEYSAALLKESARLLEDPVATCQRLASEGTASDGRPFPPAPDAAVIRRRTWATQIRLVFPWLEEQRIAFLDRHAAAAQALVQTRYIENGNHEEISDYHLLEIGNISCCKNDLEATERERQAIDLHRTARNDLAHLAPLPLEKLRDLYANPLA